MRLFDYELLHMTKPAAKQPRRAKRTPDNVDGTGNKRVQEQEAKPGGLVLTWRMRAELYEAWRNRALSAARGHNAFVLQQLLEELYRVPGFFGIRQQVGKVVALLRREYRRRHGSLVGCPKLPRLYYVTRRPNRGTRLSGLRAEALILPS